MITLFAGTDQSKDRLPLTYNGLTVNDETVNRLTTALYEINIAGVDEQWDAIVEPRAMTHGMEGYEPKKVVAMIRLDGMIRAPTLAVLVDAARALNTAMDPVNTYRADGATINRGYRPLAFSIPTADTGTYANGLVPAQYYVRSVKRPVSLTSQFDGLTCKFTLFMQAVDPRCYLQSLSSGSRSNAGTVATDNTLASFPSWPTVTFTFTGAGSGSVSIARDGTGGGTITVDATGYTTNDVMIVDMARRRITKNGVETMSDYTSGVWQEFPPESVTWTIANVSGTLAATVLVEWRRAFS